MIQSTSTASIDTVDDMVDMSQVIVSTSDMIDPAPATQTVIIGKGGVPTQPAPDELGVEYVTSDGTVVLAQQEDRQQQGLLLLDEAMFVQFRCIVHWILFYFKERNSLATELCSLSNDICFKLGFRVLQ